MHAAASDGPPRKRRKDAAVASGRGVNLDDLLKRQCRCAYGSCFTQFRDEQSAVLAKREEFRALDPLQQAGAEHKGVPRSVACLLMILAT